MYVVLSPKLTTHLNEIRHMLHIDNIAMNAHYVVTQTYEGNQNVVGWKVSYQIWV